MCQDCKTPSEIMTAVADDIRKECPIQECVGHAKNRDEINKLYYRISRMENALGLNVFEKFENIHNHKPDNPFPEQEIESVITKTKTQEWTVRDDVLDYAAAAFNQSKITSPEFFELEKGLALLSLRQCSILLNLLLSRKLEDKS